jgi:hypothetical protein
MSIIQSRLTTRWVVDGAGGNHSVNPYRECDSLESGMRHADDWSTTVGCHHDCRMWKCGDWQIERRVSGDLPILIQ